ncbi:TonB-dependent receptor [bacterium]|nr:TonB-dependent receptor [bacterium]
MKKTLLYILFFATTSAISGTIHGWVNYKSSYEPVLGANIWIKDTSIGTISNMKGYYVIPNLPPGRYVLICRYIGYKTVQEEIVITQDSDIEHNILLVEEAIIGEGVEITADKSKSERNVTPGQIVLDLSQIRRAPQVGEPDLFRTLQMLPGVATLSDFSAGLYVRGGSADQNLILLDHIDVYNPNHMFGFFSTFNTDAIKSVELLKGGFPAEYGGRLSSVLNVLNKEGNREEFEGVIRTSLISTSATFEGPWKNGSWMVSGRRTYLDLIAKAMDINLPYYFYDGHAKFNWDIDKTNYLSISGYWGNDLLDWDLGGTDILLDWGNKTFSSQWTHLFNSQLFSHFVLAGSQFHSNTRVDFEDVSFGISNEIQDWTVKGGLTYTPSVTQTLDFGFELKALNFNLKYDVVDLVYPSKYDGRYIGFFLQDNWKVSALTTVQCGARISHYTDGNYTRITPRVGIKHYISQNSYLTANYGRYAQFINLVQQEGMSFADMWFPVDKTFEPGRSDHFIIGCGYDNLSTFSVVAEIYYKDYDHVAEYRKERGADEDYVQMTAAQNFYSGKARAYGGDVLLRNQAGRFTGWFGYSLCYVDKTVGEVNFGISYSPTYDRRHTLTAIQDIRISKHLRVNFALKYASGQPYTEATGRYTAVDPFGREIDSVVEGRLNTHRLPPYFRLDLGLFYRKKLFGLDMESYIQVVNATNHENIWFRYYDTQENPAESEDHGMIPLLPTIGITIYL